jgi:hypothetical protein
VGRVVSDYRVFVLNAGGHVTTRHDFEADDDVQAVQIAQQYVDGHDVQVWQRDRMIGKLEKSNR